MTKLRIPHESWNTHHGAGHEEYLFNCPGCKHEHRIIVKWGDKSGRTQPAWSFNGDHAKPTFSPSLLVRGEKTCHSFITNGKIAFLTDCTHELAGQTVEMEEVK